MARRRRTYASAFVRRVLDLIDRPLACRNPQSLRPLGAARNARRSNPRGENGATGLIPAHCAGAVVRVATDSGLGLKDAPSGLATATFSKTVRGFKKSCGKASQPVVLCYKPPHRPPATRGR